MHQFKVIFLEKLSGNRKKILTRERIEGIVEIIPDPRGLSAALILRPLSFLENKKLNIDPGSNVAFTMRSVLDLTKSEAYRAFNLDKDELLTITRRGWGQVFTYELIKL